MELRSCTREHFIQTIRGGAVIKLLNTNRPVRPPPSFKLLKDVCETIDAKEPRQHHTMISPNTSAGFLVDRTLWEVNVELDKSVPDSNILGDYLDDTMMLRELKDRFLKRKRKSLHGDEHFYRGDAEVKDESVPHPDNGMDSNLDDDITLKQLRKRFHRKNHKTRIGEIQSTLLYSNQSSVENESNLTEPIICLKSENSTGSVDASSTTTAIMKTEQSLFIGSNLSPISPAKVEDDNMELEIPSGTSVSGLPSLCSDEVPCSGGEAPSGTQNIRVQPETREPLSSLDGFQICVPKYDHLEDIEVEPISVSLPSDGMHVTLENIDLLWHEGLEEISEQNSCFCVQNIDMVQFDDKYKACLPLEPVYSLSSPNKNCSPSQISVNSSKAFVTVAASDEEHSVACPVDEITENGSTCRTIMDDLMKDKKQALASLVTSEECQSSPKNQSADYVETDSTTEPGRPPERLLSTRKVISPSQKLLCSASKSDDDLCDDADQYTGSERKEQLNEVVTGQKDSSTKSEIQHPKKTLNRVRNRQVGQRKIYISSKNIVKSYKAKVNLEGPRYPRFLSKLSTECTSIQCCSKNAIAFSERQMHEIESLAFKLLDELDSMKSIVEQKLLFKAYRNVSLKGHAEEVKSAIGKASKTKETTRKLLSTMVRDCKRFCKIMKMTPNSIPDTKDGALTERRKIIFADEAGGKLCHIKYFEAGVNE